MITVLSSFSTFPVHVRTSSFPWRWVGESSAVAWFGLLPLWVEAGEDWDAPNWLDMSDFTSQIVIGVQVFGPLFLNLQEPIRRCNLKWSSLKFDIHHIHIQKAHCWAPLSRCNRLFQSADSCVFSSTWLQCRFKVCKGPAPLVGEVLDPVFLGSCCFLLI